MDRGRCNHPPGSMKVASAVIIALTRGTAVSSYALERKSIVTGPASLRVPCHWQVSSVVFEPAAWRLSPCSHVSSSNHPCYVRSLPMLAIDRLWSHPRFRSEEYQPSSQCSESAISKRRNCVSNERAHMNMRENKKIELKERAMRDPFYVRYPTLFF
jgi:hypothetical protein